MTGNGGPALYSVHGMVVAAVLGSFAAAVVLVVLNYRALGSVALARKAAWAGALIYLALLPAAALVPPAWGLMSVPVAQGLLAGLLGNSLQGDAIRYHLAGGGTMHSNFRAAGIAIVVACAIFGILVLTLGGAGPLPADAPS